MRDIPPRSPKCWFLPLYEGTNERITAPWATRRRRGVASGSSSAFHQFHVYSPSTSTTSPTLLLRMWPFLLLNDFHDTEPSGTSSSGAFVPPDWSHGADNEVEPETSGRLDEG